MNKTSIYIPKLIDSHCHLDYPPMANDIAGTLQRAKAAGVEQVVHIGCSLSALDRAITLTEYYSEVFAVLGIHPHEATTATTEAMDKLHKLAQHPRVVAIGETGLDYYYDRSPRAQQQAAFVEHIALAHQLQKPLVLHIRDAHEDAWSIIDEHSTQVKAGIVHCFTGGREEAKAWLQRGFYLSFSGIVTFPSASNVLEAACDCPSEQMLLETDAPFLAPIPMRGRKNEPANVAFTCKFVAEARGQSPESLAEQTTQNARQIFSLPQP